MKYTPSVNGENLIKKRMLYDGLATFSRPGENSSPGGSSLPEQFLFFCWPLIFFTLILSIYFMMSLVPSPTDTLC